LAATKPDVVVIGAGALGCNAAWHLQERGLRVLVLDVEAGPARSTTRAAAGFVGLFAIVHHSEWQAEEWAMQDYGVEFYTRLAATSDRDFAFRPSGIVYIYCTEERWRDAQPNVAAATELGTPLETLTRERAAQVLPQLRFEETAGLLFDPRSVRLRAADAIPALAQRVQARGGEIRYGVQVESFEAESDRLVALRTSGGRVDCDRAIVAAGAWSRPLLAPLGVRLPAEPVLVARYTTAPLPGVDITMPMLMFSDSVHRFWIREERGGLLIGGADPRPLPADRLVDADAPPAGIDTLPHDHAKRMRGYLRSVEHVVPALSRAEIADADAGLPVYTEDRRFVADAVPDVGGLYVVAACNEAGVTHGPALGRHLVELVVDGDTALPRSRYAIDRF
jgi:4-methylaminobutanoate oxidase (formaldehyde-forming)